jgi:hypothetical protein
MFSLTAADDGGRKEYPKNRPPILWIVSTISSMISTQLVLRYRSFWWQRIVFVFVLVFFVLWWCTSWASISWRTNESINSLHLALPSNRWLVPPTTQTTSCWRTLVGATFCGPGYLTKPVSCFLLLCFLFSPPVCCVASVGLCNYEKCHLRSVVPFQRRCYILFRHHRRFLEGKLGILYFG